MDPGSSTRKGRSARPHPSLGSIRSGAAAPERAARRTSRAAWILVLAAASTAPAAEFRPAEPLAGAPASATDLFLTIDRSGSAAVAFAAEGTVRFLPLYGIPPAAQEIQPGARPVLAAISSLQIAIAYAAPVAAGREAVDLALGGAGMFGDPERLTDAAPAGQRPSLAADPSGGLWALWEQIAPDETVLRLLRPDGRTEGIARGSRPAIAADPLGRVLAVYAREDTLYALRVETEGAGVEVAIAPGAVRFDLAPATERGWWIVVEKGGRIEAIPFVDDGPGTAVVLGGGTSPAVAAGGDGEVAAGWIDEDRILFARIGDAPPSAPQVVASGLSDPREIRLGIDPAGAAVVIFADGEGPHWTSDAVPPSAAFGAEPSQGDAPLAVRFADGSSGVVRARRWSFGDGGSSAASSPRYTFSSPGVWSVHLSIAGPGGRSEVFEAEAIRVDEPENALFFRPASAPAGARGRSLPIYARHPDPLQAISIAFAHPEGAIDIEDIAVDGTALEPLAPEYVILRRSEDAGEALLAAAIVIDWKPPYDGRLLPPGEEQIVARILYSIPPESEPESDVVLDLRDGIGDPPLGNVFTRQGAETLSPYVVDGVIHITEPSGSA
ncbi:MAG: PKD domain-containing protein, partial [Planctomycetes bacterium]|nr:PKD domain-containing protein [Planctomycetota bacterium]